MGWKKDLKASWKLYYGPVSGQRRKRWRVLNVPLWIDLQGWGLLFIPFALFSIIHDLLGVLWCSRPIEGTA